MDFGAALRALRQCGSPRACVCAISARFRPVTVPYQQLVCIWNRPWDAGGLGGPLPIRGAPGKDISGTDKHLVVSCSDRFGRSISGMVDLAYVPQADSPSKLFPLSTIDR